MKKVTIYHKDYCPYCKAAFKLLTQEGFTYKAIEVTNNPIAFAEMVKKSDRRTVPQIFINETHIGGFDDLQSRLSTNKFPFNQIAIA